jgi:hypothetical protein
MTASFQFIFNQTAYHVMLYSLDTDIVVNRNRDLGEILGGIRDSPLCHYAQNSSITHLLHMCEYMLCLKLWLSKN